MLDIFLPPIASNTSNGNLLADVLATEACLSSRPGVLKLNLTIKNLNTT